MIGNKINQKAAESYSKTFSSKILENSFPSNNSITGQQILDITPIKQVNFFVLKVLFLQWQAETKKFQSPFFDYSKAEVKDALKSLINTLSKNILIKKESFRPLLESAVLDTLTLMYNPSAFYITEFSNLPNITRIQGFKGLSKYIKIRKDIYNQIIEKLDNDGNQVIADDEIKTLVQFIMSKHSISEEELSPDIESFSSILPLAIFDEELTEEPIEIADGPIVEPVIEPILKGEITIENEEEQEETGTIIIEEDDLEEIDQETFEDDGGILIETDDIHEPLARENMDAEFSPITEVQPTQVQQQSTVNEKFAEEAPTLNEKFENQTEAASIVKAHETEKVSEIQKSINVNQRYMFLNDLFKGDNEAYNEALTEVENSNSFDDSVEILVQNYSKKYEWDMNSDEVKELLKVIFKRFR